MGYFVYWNLHKGMWSVKDITPGSSTYGKVVARVPQLLLTNVRGKVSEAGRQRVLREGRKNVHAGLVGDRIYLYPTTSIPDMIQDVGDIITYNPRKYTTFVHTIDESQFEGSAWAYLAADRKVFVA